MKKWICAMLCLSVVAGLVSIDMNVMAKDYSANSEGAAVNRLLKAESFSQPGVETAAVESGSVQTPVPPTPIQPPAKIDAPYSGYKVVRSEDVFTVVQNADSTCAIVGYQGDKSVTTLYIPEKIEGKEVASVSVDAVRMYPYLTNIVVLGNAGFDRSVPGQPIQCDLADGVNIWARTGSRANLYATERGLTFHAIDGTPTLTGKKASGLKKATLSWSAVNGAVSYNVYRKRGKEAFSLCKNVSGLTFTNEGLKAGSTYTYQVVPVFHTVEGNPIEGFQSNEAKIVLKPSKLKGVKAKAIRRKGIKVSWKRDKSVTGYQVYRKVYVKGFKTKFNRVMTYKKNKMTSYRNKMTVAGMKYSYRVRSFKKVGGKKIYGPFVTVTTRAK